MAAKKMGRRMAAARMRYRRGFRLSGASSAAVGRAVESAIADLRRIYRGLGSSESFIPDHLVSGHLEAAVRGVIGDAENWSDSTLVQVARHRLGGSHLDQDLWESRPGQRRRRGVLVLWRWNRSPRGKHRVEAVAVLYAARFRDADWTPISYDPVARLIAGRDREARAKAAGCRLALTNSGRWRLAWACVLPARAGDVARLYPECGLP